MDISELIKTTLEQIKNDLGKSAFPIEKYFDDDNYIYLFSVKEIDDFLAFSVGVNKKGTDVLFSNFLADGTPDDIEKYIGKQDLVNDILKRINDLTQKVENKD